MLNVKPGSHNRDSVLTQRKPFFTRTLRNFFRKRTAVTLVEFAVIAIPFFTLIVGIIEVGLVFWAGYELENATAAAARLVRTGRAQTSGYTVDQLRSQLCQNVVILSNCSTKVQLSVQTFPTFAGITSPNAVNQNGGLQTNFNYSPGGPGAIVFLVVFYEWPLTTPLTSATLANLGDGNFLLQSSFAFRNEPYS
jgi:Flp pilus assembly protein TadG